MATIRKIELHLRTGSAADADTDGDVFLGLCGREFFVDSAESGYNDFERGDDKTYIFGEGANVMRPAQNDPRSPLPCDANDLTRYPIYLRFVPGPGGDWNIGLVELTVHAPNIGQATFSRLEGNSNIWLGAKRGLFLYFR